MAKSIVKEKKEEEIRLPQSYKVKWKSDSGYVSGIGQVDPGKEFKVPDQISFERAKILEDQKHVKRLGD